MEAEQTDSLGSPYFRKKVNKSRKSGEAFGRERRSWTADVRAEYFDEGPGELFEVGIEEV